MLRDLARSVLFPGCPVGFPPARELARLAPGARIAEVRTGDGLALLVAFCPSGVEDAPVAVYFHGNGESAAQNLPLARVAGAAGVDVLLAEYRGYGGNPGSPSEAGLYEDAEAALAWLEAQGIARGRVILTGRSIGTGVAVEMAHRGHGRALVLVSPFTRIADLARRMIGPLAAGLVFDPFDNLAKIAKVRVPVVVVHGTEDELIPYGMGTAIAKAAPDGRLVAVDGGTHNELPGLPGILARELAALTPARG